MPCSIFFHHSVPFLISLNLLFRTIKSRNFVLCNICFKLHLLHTPYDFSVQGDLQSMLIIRTPTMDWEWGAYGEDVCHLWNLEKILLYADETGMPYEAKGRHTGIQRTPIYRGCLSSDSSPLPGADIHCGFFSLALLIFREGSGFQRYSENKPFGIM